MALLDDILKLLGTNRTRMQWKVRAWKRGWEKRKASLSNRGASLTYAHKTCPSCGHPAGADETTCSRCATALGGMASHRARRLAALVWSPGTPAVASLLVFSCVLVYAFVLVWQNHIGLASSRNLAPHTYALWRFGSEFSPDILERHQWWRCITAVFLHGGLIHLAMNMLSLWSVATYLEETIGKAKTLALYVLLGLTASAFSLWWHTRSGGIGNSVGASGAICGLIGVAVGFSTRHRNAARHLQSHYIGWALWIVIIGFSGFNIDNAGHVGGFVPGFLLGLVVRRRNVTGHVAHRLWTAGALLALAGTIACFVLMANSPLTHEQLFGSDDDSADTEDLDSGTRAAIIEANKTFERAEDYMPAGVEMTYPHARTDGRPDGELAGRMRRLFGDPPLGVWRLADRGNGTQLRISEGSDEIRVDGPAGEASFAHLVELIDRARPADFHGVYYMPGVALDQQMRRGHLEEHTLGYGETLDLIDRQLAAAKNTAERAWVLDSALRFYTGTAGHQADRPRFVAYLAELRKLGIETYGEDLGSFTAALGAP
ncbi:MAG TPA: rhomboid family intramembrane serine protease [Kofleriaceae bacterium]|nr:rhomboid family intramembrane serine protease [Kofleriaceae bacterium]